MLPETPRFLCIAETWPIAVKDTWKTKIRS
jgi:hypothetical protein